MDKKRQKILCLSNLDVYCLAIRAVPIDMVQ